MRSRKRLRKSAFFAIIVFLAEQWEEERAKEIAF